MTHFENNDCVYDLYKKGGKEIIIYEGTVYDVSTFMTEHPGGPEKIQEYMGKDIKEPFEEENHSKSALRSLLKLPVVGHVLSDGLQEKLEIEIDLEYKKSFCCSRDYVIKKLFTKEDPIYLHKTLGLLSVISFIYRYLYVLPMTGTLGFDGSWFDHLTVFLHTALSSSSLIFHVLPVRIQKRPLVIWNEYRLHAIIFTVRSVSIYLFGLYYPYQNNETDNLVLFLFIMAHHLVVDETTRRFGPGDLSQTTIRGRSDEDGKAANALKSHISILWFYAFYQFCATGSMLIPNPRQADMGYNVIIAIQSSAFMMTLFRKGLIRWYTHFAWYTFALVLSQLAIRAAVPNVTYFYAKIALMFFFRVNFRMNKYLIWAILSTISLPSVENVILQKLGEATSHAYQSEYFNLDAISMENLQNITIF